MTTQNDGVGSPLSDEIWKLLDAVSELAGAPLNRIAESLHKSLDRFYKCTALVIFTEDCTGRPQKKSGDEDVVSRVSISELDRLRAALPDEEPLRTTALLAGQARDVLAVTYRASNALLVLTEPTAVRGSPEELDAIRLLIYLWRLVARRIQEKVSDAPPAYLVESRAASAERVRVTAELVDQHSTTLETVLAALRTTSMEDRTARAVAADFTIKALVDLRTLNDRTSDIEEPVVTGSARTYGP